MLASIVIRAKNEARFIGETLAAIHGQREERHEVIVVDSGSTDGTQDIVRRSGATLLEIPAREFTYGYALNHGMRAASGDVLFSLSAHCLPLDFGWLAAGLAGFADSTVAGVYGRQVPRQDANTADRLAARFSGADRLTPTRSTRGMSFSNANSAVRRDVWETQPFDELLAGAEDLAWARQAHRRGYAIVYQPAMAVYHSHNESLGRLARRLWHDQPVIARLALGLYGDLPRLRHAPATEA